MRDYSKLSPQFWLCDIGRKLRMIGPEAQLVALYLMSSPHSTMTGIYYIPYLLMAHETGLTEEKIRAVMQQLIACQFCSYDETYEFVWVHDMARCQIAPQLKPNDNRVKTVNKFLAQLPKLHFIEAFFAAYQEDFHLNKHPLTDSDIVIPTKTLSAKPHPSTSALLDKEPNDRESPTLGEAPLPEPPPPQKKAPEAVRELPPGVSHSIGISAQCIFEHWKKLTHQPNASLSSELLQAIQRILVNGFTELQLIQACEVCVKRNPHATEFELLHLLSQRTLFEEALGIAPQPKSMSEMAYQFLDSIKGGDYGTESTAEF